MSTISQNALSDIFPKRLGIFSPNFARLLNIHRVQIFIQLSANLTKLCHIKRDHPVHNHHVRKMSTIGRNAFSDIFPKGFGIFIPNFTCLLYVPIYAGLQIFIQLSATLTKLCHIKRDHHNVQCSKCPPFTEAHAG